MIFKYKLILFTEMIQMMMILGELQVEEMPQNYGGVFLRLNSFVIAAMS